MTDDHPHMDVEGYLGSHGLIVRESYGERRRLVINCPFCMRPKCYVTDDNGLWICLRAKCGRKGDFLSLVEAVEHCSTPVARDIVRRLKDRIDFGTVEDFLKRYAEIQHQPKLTDEVLLPEGFEPVWDGQRWRWPRYLTQRGISQNVALAYKLGYCRSGPYADRLILPVYEDGNLMSWQARSAIGAEPKYLSATTNSRGKLLFGFDQLPENAREVVVVEGPIDVLALARAEVPAVALMGTHSTPAQAFKLATRGVEVAHLCLDPEGTFLARQKVRAALKGHLRLRELPPGDGEDPGASSEPSLRAAWGNRIRS